MHIGNLRSGLYAYLFARKHGGKFLLRIEDTDQGRFVEGATELIYRTLKDVGMDWDEGPDIGGDYGPYIQSSVNPCTCPMRSSSSPRATPIAASVPRRNWRRAARRPGPGGNLQIRQALPPSDPWGDPGQAGCRHTVCDPAKRAHHRHHQLFRPGVRGHHRQQRGSGR